MPTPFVASSQDPLANEHALVSAFVENAVKTLSLKYQRRIDLKKVSGGAYLLEGDPEQSRRYVLAAITQVQYWNNLASQHRVHDETNQITDHLLNAGMELGKRHCHAATLVSALLRRSLPFEKADFVLLLNWCASSVFLTTYYIPTGAIVRALERYAAKNPIDDELMRAMKRFAAELRSSHYNDAKRWGGKVEQLYATPNQEEPFVQDVPTQPPPRPGMAGDALVLTAVKQELEMLAVGMASPTSALEPDQFVMPDDSPLRNEHRLLGSLLVEVGGDMTFQRTNVKRFAEGRRLMALEPIAAGRALLAAAERHLAALMLSSVDFAQARIWDFMYATAGAFRGLASTNFELDRNGLFDLSLSLSLSQLLRTPDSSSIIERVTQQAVKHARESPLAEGERFVLSLLRNALVSAPCFGSPPERLGRLTSLVNDGAVFYLVPGEAWTDTLNHDVSALDDSRRAAWVDFLKHSSTATSSRPSAKWLKTANQLLRAIGACRFSKSLRRWFALVIGGQAASQVGDHADETRGNDDAMHQENADCLRGMLWCVPLLRERDQFARDLTAVALSAYRKTPGVGPRAVKVGNAAVYALSQMASKDVVGQLAMLKVRVRFGPAQKEIEKAFDAAAAALELPRDQIEELGVPAYGMEEVGLRSEAFGAHRAELRVNGSSADLRWFDANGKALKGVPAKVKSEHGEELKELRQSLKDIQSMLPAQRDRIDRLFLSRKGWPIVEWRERYLDHPLVGTIARRLIWFVDGTPALLHDGCPRDVDGAEISHGKAAEARLWHPVGRSTEEIVAWRRRLETLAITQPFKQAYREIYLLTDAERNTRTYSNRFAAHVIRQHQFNALCGARGWKSKLRLMVDDEYPPATKELPQFGLRAEFWVEGIGDEYGTDTNETGTFLRLATDQVRFYRWEAAGNRAHAWGGRYGSAAAGPGQDNVNEPIPLEQVPELVFSEIMRDVDLFVGVASVGNDPDWQDGGPEGRYREYWRNYSFGELSGTASTRKQVLERLVPRLKIASRCSFSDRFLIVEGNKRTYKIHLGSGNILMEPNDQYLCIVPDARARAAQGDLYLPFEGDSTLSVIISKALLLADDTKIKDPTITRQIDAKSMDS